MTCKILRNKNYVYGFFIASFLNYLYNVILFIVSGKVYCSTKSTPRIATYDEVKDIPNHPDKLLIDVREPQELKDTGCIPASINVPRMCFYIFPFYFAFLFF